MHQTKTERIIADRSAEFMVGLYPIYAARGNQYHGLSHITFLLANLAKIAEDENLTQESIEFLVTCIWLHDAYYDPTAPAGFNEAMSAGLAKMLPADLRGSVRSAIMATANHTRHQTVSDDVEIFLDLDLLGFADPSCLTTAEDALRREYPTVSDEQFAEKRCAFLRVMLERAISTGLYYRPIHKARALNALAIQNIQALLARYNAG